VSVCSDFFGNPRGIGATVRFRRTGRRPEVRRKSENLPVSQFHIWGLFKGADCGAPRGKSDAKAFVPVIFGVKSNRSEYLVRFLRCSRELGHGVIIQSVRKIKSV